MRLLLVFLFLPAVSFSQLFSSQEISRYKAQSRQVTIIRDQWDVPHIYGRTDADAVFGLLYSQCEENFPRVEKNYLEMMGRISELEGKGQLYQDLQMRLIYDSAAAIADYKKSPAWLKKLLDAFADGVNFYLYTHPEVKPRILKKFEPWFPLLYTDGSIAPTQNGGLTLKDMQNLYAAEVPATSYIKPPVNFLEAEPTGSNGFALAPSRTASKNAMLYINPHVTFYFRSEVHLVSGEGLNAYGAVTWGQFFVYQGFNEYCGWMHTSSYADVADLFSETTEKRGDNYFQLYDGKWLPLKNHPVKIRYVEGDSLKEQSFTTYSSVHGPVMGERDGKWISLKENNRSLDALMQSWLRTKAKGFEEFRKIMDMRSNNSNNTVFADNKGNIAYWHGNFIPRRNSKFDYGLPVDGSTAATNWKGIHKLDETIHVYNPASGWIQNCNSTPFSVSGSSSPKKENYPVYMAPDGQNFRALNAMKLLSKSANLTMDDLIKNIGYSHYLSAFDVLLPGLFSAYQNLDANDSLKSLLEEPVYLLSIWNKESSASSIAASLAIEWAYRMLQRASAAAHPYKITDALGQLNSAITNTTNHQKLELLIETVRDLQQRFGSWKTAWGDVNRYQRSPDEHFDDKAWSLPVGLAAATWGCLPSFATRRFPGTNRRYGVSGNSFIACVEFGKKLKAKTVITGGQSFNPASKHFTDQASMYINGEFKDVLFYREDVLKHAVKQYHPGE